MGWRASHWAFVLLCIGSFAVIVFNACIFDDPYITFRVIDNFVHGYGLRWNVDERVQAYTHPLWMLLHIPFYAAFGNIYWVTIGLSVFFGTLAVALLLKLARPLSYTEKTLLILLPLLLSRTFRNYVICGLENPLSFFLFAWILLELFAVARFSFYRLCFLASLAVITRFDNIVPLLPLLAGLAWQRRRELHVGKLIAAISPALLWHGFSLLYYGFFLPNTKYAKINMGIPESEYWQQGFFYLVNFMKTDLIAFLWTGAGIMLALSQRKGSGPDSKEGRLFLLGLGMLLNIVYILAVGGDFMPGRFFATLFLIAIAIVFLTVTPLAPVWMKKLLFAVCALTVLDHALLQPFLPDRRNYAQNNGIDDQHDYYFATNGLRSDPNHVFRREPSSPWIDDGRAMAAQAGDKPTVFISAISGMKYYYAGPRVIILDHIGLADALTARLPVRNPKSWRIGHPDRNPPPGYLEARQTGDLSKMDAALAQYYAKLQLVTSGPLFDRERLTAILGFQLGLYDHWRNDYIKRTQPPL